MAANSVPSIEHVLNLLGGYRMSYAMFAALNHGIFENLEKSDEGRTAEQTAKDLTLDETATTVLLDTCTSVDLLVKEIPNGEMVNARYSNSEHTKRYLLANSPESLYSFAILMSRLGTKHIVNFAEHVIKEGANQQNTEQVLELSSKEPFENLYKTKDKMVAFGEAMHALMTVSLPTVLGPFDLSRFNHLCDLGGSGGTLSYAAVKAYPKMKSTVFELQRVVDIADHFRPSAEECPNRDKVTFVAGDFFKDDLPPADLYSLVQILHSWDEEKIDLLLSKVYASLPSGGGILIGAFIPDDDMRGPPLDVSQSMLMHSICPGCRERSGKEHGQLLTKHGFVEIQCRPSPIPNLAGAVFARKP
ncbi:acetylserotonin O-methyltransferase-like isoform X2 [Dendronephthya gigantea]|uniref:acetylserotonin O-methyltransferase-like isoform X2 n=1 Tax=Dendronephthya gigantea TaxID=151771 RepID=UPI00106A6EA7|nr:acetylserotonin O-methyltransferase-like isoform X2 [Dendronephthya gigantea]